jgi:hypothetical protein
MIARSFSLGALIAVVLLGGTAHADAQGRGGRGAAAGPPQTPRQAAPIDLTGYWVSFITEDWRFRMITPPKGDYARVPLTPEGRKVADAWDPKADEAAGNQCKTYGVGGIMRVPGRAHITWQDDTTLKVDFDAGTQTRTLRFAAPATPGAVPASAPAPAGERSWQGQSTARWDIPAKSLTVVTTNMRAGYLRRNGVPYSENATITEHFDIAPHPSGGQLLVVTTIVDDPQYLQRTFVTSTNFKKEGDGSKWSPTPCITNW